MRWFLLTALAVWLLAVCALDPVLAATGQAVHTLDLSPILDACIQGLAAILLAAGSWGIGALVRTLKLDADASVRTYLEAALQAGIAAAAGRARAAGASLAHPAVRSRAVAEVVNYVTPKVPAALKRLGIGPDHLAGMVAARLDAAFPVAPDQAAPQAAQAPGAATGGVLRSPLIGGVVAIALSLLVAAALAGCATTTAVREDGSPRQTVFAIKADYAALLTAVAAYEGLPRCQGGQTFARDRCSDAAAVARIRRADDAVHTAADAAEAIVRRQGGGRPVDDALRDAGTALDALRTIYNQALED